MSSKGEPSCHIKADAIAGKRDTKSAATRSMSRFAIAAIAANPLARRS
jgi:hypothetical protein